MIRPGHAIILVALALVVTVKAKAQEINAQAFMQKCKQDSECILVSSECGNSCETTPINRDYLPSFKSAFDELCGSDIESGVCKVDPEISAICQSGTCTIDLAYKETSIEGEVSDGRSSLMFSEIIAQEENGLFTAYDLDRKDVEMGTLGQLRISEEQARSLHREYWD